MGQRGQWYPPNLVMKHREIVNRKLEKCPMDLVPWEPRVPPMTYFNNQKHFQPYSAYDSFFNVTEGWDPHIHRCDRHHSQPIHENVFIEEKDKRIPVLTSLIYGRPCRPILEETLKGKGRVTATKSFYSRTGTNMAPGLEKTVQH